MKKVNDFLAAVGLLTVIPVKSPSPWEDRGKLAAFPLVGLLIGLGLLLVDHTAARFLNPAGTAFADVLYLILISGGLHLDGLADSADGLFSHRDRESILEIMKDSRTGVFGILALIMVLAAKWIGIASMHPALRPVYLVFIPMYSRAAMLAGLAYTEPARKEASMARDLFVARPGGSVRLMLAGSAVLPMLFHPRLGLGLGLLAAATVFLWSRACRRRIGGMTGDTLGAACELTEAVLLLTGCIC